MSPLERHITQRFHKACKDYALLEDNDHILVGLSGGKDSMALVQLLGEQQKIYVPRIRVTALHVSIENIDYQSDLNYLQSFCHQHGVELLHETIRFDDSGDYRKTHCFLCSWNRRKTLFEVAQRLGCNKIALGHHRDDIVETFLLNLVFQGSTESILPKLQMRKFPITLIRPLCLIEEKDLQSFAALQDYHKQEKLCPYEHESHRTDIKQLVTQLETLNPHIRETLWRAMMQSNK